MSWEVAIMVLDELKSLKLEEDGDVPFLQKNTARFFF